MKHLSKVIMLLVAFSPIISCKEEARSKGGQKRDYAKYLPFYNGNNNLYTKCREKNEAIIASLADETNDTGQDTKDITKENMKKCAKGDPLEGENKAPPQETVTDGNDLTDDFGKVFHITHSPDRMS